MNYKKNKRNARVKVWAWRITHRDVRNMEKIIKKHLAPLDQYIELKRNVKTYSSINHLSSKRKYYRNIHLKTTVPNMDIYIRWFSVKVFGHRTVNTGDALERVDKTVSELQRYLEQRRSAR